MQETNYLIRWTQANQLSNKLTVINRRLEGQPGGLQSGFALHLLESVLVVGVTSSEAYQLYHYDAAGVYSEEGKATV